MQMEENGLAFFFANLGTQKTTRSLYKYLEKPEEMLENTLAKGLKGMSKSYKNL